MTRSINPRRNIPDYLYDYEESENLVNKIKEYWLQRGKQVNVWIETSRDLTSGRKQYSIRSNIKFK